MVNQPYWTKGLLLYCLDSMLDFSVYFLVSLWEKMTCLMLLKPTCLLFPLYGPLENAGRWWYWLLIYSAHLLSPCLLYIALIRNWGDSTEQEASPLFSWSLLSKRSDWPNGWTSNGAQAGQCESEKEHTLVEERWHGSCGTLNRLTSYHFCSWMGSCTLLGKLGADAKALKIQKNVSRKVQKQD